MSAITFLKDRFGRAYRNGIRIVYPTRRGSRMELIEATVIGNGYDYARDTLYGEKVLFAKRKSGAKVTLRNLWDVVVIPS